MSGILGILLTPQQGPRVFSAGAALAPFPAQPFSLPPHLFSVEPVRLPSSDLHPLHAEKGRSPRPRSLRLSPLLRALAPQATGTAAKCKEEPAARLRACALGRASPTATTGHHLAAPGRWDAGGVGSAAGARSVLSEREGDRPRNIPLFRKFPFRGHGVCARMARGAPGGGVGVDRVPTRPPGESAAGGRRQTARSRLEAVLPALDPGAPREPYPSSLSPPARASQTPPLAAL